MLVDLTDIPDADITTHLADIDDMATNTLAASVGTGAPVAVDQTPEDNSLEDDLHPSSMSSPAVETADGEAVETVASTRLGTAQYSDAEDSSDNACDDSLLAYDPTAGYCNSVHTEYGDIFFSDDYFSGERGQPSWRSSNGASGSDRADSVEEDQRSTGASDHHDDDEISLSSTLSSPPPTKAHWKSLSYKEKLLWRSGNYMRGSIDASSVPRLRGRNEIPGQFNPKGTVK